MPDRAHKETDILLSRLERQLNMIYADAARKIRKQAAPLLAEMYVDDKTATQKQRIDYANRNGLKKLVKELAPIILDANQAAIGHINNVTALVYAINHDYAVDDMERQAGRKLGVERYEVT